MNIILSLGIIFLTGIIANKLVNKLRLPEVTGDLILGIIIGQELLGLVHTHILAATGFISNIVLGFVAFAIGRNFSLKEFKKIAKPVLWISIFEAVGAWIIVTLVFHFLLRQPLYISLLYGSISSATAPAATLMVIRQFKAKGLFTKILLGVVAMDDAWCLIIFAFSFAIAKALFLHHSSELFIIKVSIKSLIEITGALLLGGFLGFVLATFSRFFKRHTEIEIYTLSFVFLSIGAAMWLHFSVLLTTMALGATLVNLRVTSRTFFEVLQDIESPLYLLFFVLAGANLEIASLRVIGLAGISYFFARLIGKFTGAFLGSTISKTPKLIRKYIGLGLVPQAGVALGVALIAKANFPEIGNTIFSTIVATTIVYELIGPILIKIGLSKTGSIPQPESVKT